MGKINPAISQNARVVEYDVQNLTIGNSWGSLYTSNSVLWETILPQGTSHRDVKSVMWIPEGPDVFFLIKLGNFTKKL